MLVVRIPSQPLPSRLESKVRSLQAKLQEISLSDEERVQAQEALSSASQKVLEFVHRVGMEDVPVPREIVGQGDAAVDAFIETQKARVASESAGNQPAPGEEE